MASEIVSLATQRIAALAKAGGCAFTTNELPTLSTIIEESLDAAVAEETRAMREDLR